MRKLKFSVHQELLCDKAEGTDATRFEWLLTPYEALVWQLKPHIETDEISRYTIGWGDVTTSGRSGWSYWVGLAKELTALKIERSDRASVKTSSLALYARNTKAFCRFLFVNRNCSMLQDVIQADVEAYKSTLVSRQLSSSTLEGYLMPVQDFYSLGKRLSDKLPFNPFPIASLFTWAKTHGEPDGHTPTLLPKEVFYLLNEALKRVKNADADLLLLDAAMELKDDYKTTSRDGYSGLFYRRHKRRVSDVFERIRELYGAALIVTLLLTAERKHEAALRNDDDVIKLLNNEADIMFGLEKKTSGMSSGKHTEVAVIDEVRLAFEVILKITKYKRQESGLTKILLKTSFSHSTSGGTKKSFYLHTRSLYILLDRFVASIGLNVTLRPHMLRRAYAMLWSWRYEVGDLDELSIMLKHNNKIFTERYANDENIWEFMPEVEQKMAFDVLNHAFLKKTKICGGASESLQRFGRLIFAKSKILQPTAIAEFIHGLIENGDVRIVSHADGYCVITQASKSRSKCLDEAGELDVARRDAQRCVGCPNLAIDDKRRAFWEKRIELHQRVIDCSTNALLVSSSEQFIKEAKIALATNAF